MASTTRLHTLESTVRRPSTARRRQCTTHDAGDPIALAYSVDVYLPAAAPRAWPSPSAHSFGASVPEWVPPAPAPPSMQPAGTRKPSHVWSDVVVQAPATARPAVDEPQPRFTEADDEAAASSFAADVARLRSVGGDEVRSRAPDEAEFLSRAVAEAPKPLPPERPPPTDDEEAVEQPERWRYGHDVFDRMTAYANQFDLGPVAVNLEGAFAAFDRGLEADLAAREKRSPVRAQAATADIARDVARIREEVARAAAADDEEAEEQEETEEPEAEEESTDAQSFSVVFDVPLVPQQTGYSCWAAGAAMLVAWRDNISIDPSEIAAATGYWEQYKHGLAAEDTTMFKAWGLIPEPPQTYTVPGFRALLERWGPLWVASAEPGPHIRVVRGIEGDGTPTGTQLHILDPWEPGMVQFRLPNAGGRYTETYAQFEAKQASLARSESNVQGIYVAHLATERSR